MDNLKIVLVNPKYPENIGSVCRAMKTMGIKNLSIIANKSPDLDKAGRLAVHAADLLDKIKIFSHLEEAVKDGTLIAAITRRRGKRRKYYAVMPEELARKIKCNPENITYLVFGNEEYGLTEKDLACCHLAVKIPTSPEFPSLNLSHAVQIITYTLYRELNSEHLPQYTPISDKKLRELVLVISTTLKNIGFFKIVKKNDLSLFFKDILARSGLSGRESKRLEIVFRKINGIVVNKEGNP